MSAPSVYLLFVLLCAWFYTASIITGFTHSLTHALLRNQIWVVCDDTDSHIVCAVACGGAGVSDDVDDARMWSWERSGGRRREREKRKLCRSSGLESNFSLGRKRGSMTHLFIHFNFCLFSFCTFTIRVPAAGSIKERSAKR